MTELEKIEEAARWQEKRAYTKGRRKQTRL